MQPKLQTLLLLCLLNIPATGTADAFQAYATVVHVQPITETVYEPVTRRVCTDPARSSREFTEVSATIGKDIRRQEQLWQARRSCRTVTETQTHERITSYRVTYRYRGHTSTRRLSYHPGDRVPVNVSLSPLP